MEMCCGCGSSQPGSCRPVWSMVYGWGRIIWEMGTKVYPSCKRVSMIPGREAGVCLAVGKISPPAIPLRKWRYYDKIGLIALVDCKMKLDT